MEHELVFWLEVSFQNGPPRIEAVQARDKLDAHRAVAQKYGAQYAGSGILGNTPQSKLIYIASPYAGDIAGNTQFAIQCCQFAIQRGYTPVASHLIYPQILDDTIPEQRELGLTLFWRPAARCGSAESVSATAWQKKSTMRRGWELTSGISEKLRKVEGE